MNYYLFLLNTNAPPKQKEASQTHFSVYTAVNKEEAVGYLCNRILNPLTRILEYSRKNWH